MEFVKASRCMRPTLKQQVCVCNYFTPTVVSAFIFNIVRIKEESSKFDSRHLKPGPCLASINKAASAAF